MSFTAHWSRRLMSRFIADEADVLRGQDGAAPISRAGRTPTVFCIHGFTGTPAEVGLVVDVAQSLGLAAEAPLLPGHGTSSDELALCHYVDWWSHAKQEFDRVRSRGPVILVGLSLGSLLATELCLSAPGDVLGLALLANAFWLKAPYPRYALQAARRTRLPNWPVRKGESDLGDELERRAHLSYRVQPIHAAVDVMLAGERVRELLDRVHRPTLILHGAQDRVCPVSNAWRVAERLGTQDAQVVIYPRSHHILTRDVERERVRQSLRRFFVSRENES